MICPHCANMLRPGDQFCLKCGSPAPPPYPGEEATAPSTPPPEDYKPPQQQLQSYPAQEGETQPSQTGSTYPPQQPPPDARSQANILLGLAMVFSLIGGIMLMVLEFGGWYNYNDYHHTREWGWVGPLENPVSFLPFLLVAGSLWYCTYIAYQGFSSKVGLNRSLIQRGFVISLIVFIIVIIGGATLIILTIENDSQWLSAGFYGGAIGSLLTFILFWLGLKNIPKAQGGKRPGYGAPPYGAQQRYPQTQAPQSSAPSQQSPPETAQEPQATEADKGKEEKPVQEDVPKSEEEPEPEKQEPQPTQQPQPQQQQYPQQYQQPYQQPYYQQHPQPQTYPCRTCGRPLRYVPEYRRWYCDTCRRYV